MIEISYNQANGYEELRISGHALYAQNGEDIVCAAVSSLFYALARNLEINAEWITELVIDDESEERRIVARSDGGFSLDLHMYYDFVMNGLRLIAETYPNNVKIFPSEVREKKIN